MPINEWINRENVLLAYSGLVFTAIKKKKKRNYAICNNTDKPWGHQVKWI